MSEEFYRIKRLPPYVIAEVNAMRAARARAVRTSSTWAWAIPTCRRPITSSTSWSRSPRSPMRTDIPSPGDSGLRRAQANYYGRRFGVDLDPETEVVVTMGSKEGLASLATAITAPGDVVLAPNPSYPIHTFGFIIAGATIRAVPTTPDEAYFESLERAMHFTVPRPSVLVVNYPSNPTAETVDLAFYERLVAFAKKHELWVLSDLAYSELYYDGNPTPSILQVKGGKDVAVEFTSLSKTYSMAGWRIGFAVGNKRLIAAMTRVKSYLDYGAFTPIQAAACAALNGPQDIVEKNRQLYHKRRDVLVESFGRAGWDIPSPRPRCSPGPLPPALAHLGSLEFSKQLLTEAKVAVAPGVGYGENGEGFVRIAMVENEQRLRQAARNVKRYLQSMGVNTPGSAKAV